MSEPTAEQRQPVNIEDEMQRSYLDYAMSVIVGRALPDVRDGLKPVHRRVLFSMREMGNDYNKPYKKSARVVGDVMGKYHPHGDSAIYDTIVRMAQNFSMRHMLVDGQGNFGSVDGDSPAAMRYTEVRMARLAHELLSDIDKETVDFVPNYDGSEIEPQVLPARFPNLLVNGSSGIAVGMATNIPPHNLGEVIDATCALIDDPTLDNMALFGIIPGPDFPTGGIIFGRRGIVEGYETGRGTVIVRAQTKIENFKDGRESIIVTELPYQVNKARLVERIAELVREKRLEGISDLRDESDREGMRVVIELKRDAFSEVVLNQLFKQTPMQSSFGINTLALVGGRPQLLSLKELLAAFIQHRREVVIRRTLFELNKAQSRAHILEGLAVALANIDRVVALIRASTSSAEAKERLVAELWESGPILAMLERAQGGSGVLITSTQFEEGGYRLSETQAQNILDMRLHRLTGLEQDKIHQEFSEILTEIAYLKSILASESKLMEVIKGELLAIKEQFADARRTRIVEASADLTMEDLINEEGMVVTVSHAGYVKRQPMDDYRAQRRGGKGRSAADVREHDFLEQIFIASTHDTIFCFSDQGRVFKLKVYEIPQAGHNARGKAIINLLPLEQNEKVRQILPARIARDEMERWDLVFATRKGLVKRTTLAAYTNIRANGIRAIDLVEGDDLIGVALLPERPDPNQPEGEDEETDGEELLEEEGGESADGEDEEEGTGGAVSGLSGRLMLISASGKTVRFRSASVRRTGRVARGVRGMRLKANDRVIALVVIEPECEILTITENGFGKRTREDLFPTKGRGTQGVIGIITSPRNGEVVAALAISVRDHVMLITDQGTALRTDVESIRSTGRSTQGVSILRTRGDERVVAVARLAEEANGTDDPVLGGRAENGEAPKDDAENGGVPEGHVLDAAEDGGEEA